MSAQTRGVYALGSALALAAMTLAKGSSALVFVLLVFAILSAAIAALGPSRLSIALPDLLLAITVRAFLGLGIFIFSIFFLFVGSSTPIGIVGRVAIGAVVVGSAISMAYGGRRRISMAIFFLSYTMATGWLLLSQSYYLGYIDVALFQEMASAALREGVNPYSITFPDLYGARSVLFYGPGVSIDGVLQFGFPYLPLGLLVVAPFQWVLADFRIAHLLAIVGAGVMMAMLGDGWVSRAAAAAFLMIAPVPVVVAVGWTEPLMVLALVAVLLSSRRRSSGLPYLLGIVLATKQTAVLLFAPSVLLYDRPWSFRVIARDLAKTLATLAVLTVPFVLWNPSAFYRSVVALQFIQPFRLDSLAFPALFANFFGGYDRRLLVALPFLGIVLVAVATLRRTPTGPQGFALASALTLIVAFAFSKQAFSNYYLLPLALLAGAAALADSSDSSESESSAAVVESETSSSEILAGSRTPIHD